MSQDSDSEATEAAKNEFDTEFDIEGGTGDPSAQFSMGHPDCNDITSS